MSDAMTSDVKFHEFFALKYFMKYFMKYFKNFTMFFYGFYTQPFNIFYTSNITFHSFRHTDFIIMHVRSL